MDFTTGADLERGQDMQNTKKERISGRNAAAQAGGLLFFAALMLQLLARTNAGFAQWYVDNVYPLLTGSLGRISGWVPFSVSELLLYLLLPGLLFLFFRFRKEKKRFFSFCFCLASGLFFSYTVCCGINYFCRPFSSYLEYETGTYRSEDLKQLLIWLTEEVNESAERLYGEGGGAEVREDMSMENWKQQEELARLGVEAMTSLGEEYPPLKGYYPLPKPLVNSRFLSVQQLTGIYSPFTIEANYNREMTSYNIPHTICHELSHLRGFMREDEANFIGFLACLVSEDERYRYSGFLTAWIYAGNALAGESREDYRSCWEALSAPVHKDLEKNTVFWNRFESEISEAAETMNDTYLKANRQTDGVKSYGRMVDLMLAWYRQMICENPGETAM